MLAGAGSFQKRQPLQAKLGCEAKLPNLSVIDGEFAPGAKYVSPALT
jgi:hypothetical protein